MCNAAYSLQALLKNQALTLQTWETIALSRCSLELVKLLKNILI